MINGGKDLPEKYLDPISLVVMNDPVTIDCGHTFDKVYIVRWLDTQLVCPICRRHVSHRMIPNLLVKSEIEEYGSDIKSVNGYCLNKVRMVDYHDTAITFDELQKLKESKEFKKWEQKNRKRRWMKLFVSLFVSLIALGILLFMSFQSFSFGTSSKWILDRSEFLWSKMPEWFRHWEEDRKFAIAKRFQFDNGTYHFRNKGDWDVQEVQNFVYDLGYRELAPKIKEKGAMFSILMSNNADLMRTTYHMTHAQFKNILQRLEAFQPVKEKKHIWDLMDSKRKATFYLMVLNPRLDALRLYFTDFDNFKFFFGFSPETKDVSFVFWVYLTFFAETYLGVLFSVYELGHGFTLILFLRNPILRIFARMLIALCLHYLHRKPFNPRKVISEFIKTEVGFEQLTFYLFRIFFCQTLDLLLIFNVIIRYYYVISGAIKFFFYLLGIFLYPAIFRQLIFDSQNSTS